MSDKAPTHTAYALRLEAGRRKVSRWLEIGIARIEGPDKPAHISIDRTPIGGWNGYIYLAPIGAQPPDPEAEPQHPLHSKGEQDQ